MRWLVIYCVIFVAGCTSDITLQPVVDRQSTWGKVEILGQAQQAEPPALLTDNQDFSAAWIITNTVDTYHVVNETLLTIPTTYPRNQALYPAENAFKHLLWIDAAYEGEGLRVWSAWISPDETTERGPIPVSDRPTYHYDALSMDDESLWLAWSGDLPGEPNIYVQYIDKQGRNRAGERVASSADFPVFVDGKLFWIGILDAMVHQADFVDGVLENERELVRMPDILRGDLLLNFQVGQDVTHTYLIWNIQRASGAVETWLSAGMAGDDNWTVPIRLGIDPQQGTEFETGFNGGFGLIAQAGEVWLSWGAVLPGTFNHLVIAAQAGNQLGVVYLAGGEVVGWQSVVTLPIGLIGSPQIRTNRELHLFLAWAEPTGNGYADLSLTTTRR